MELNEHALPAGTPVTEVELQHLVGRFLSRTLPKPEWTHAAHVIVALWHLREFDEATTLYVLRERISAYNESVGVMNTPTGGYHETLTVFWVRLAALLLAQTTGFESFETVVTRALPHAADKSIPLRFYTRDRIFSVEARHGFVEPDLRPLPFRIADLAS